MKVALIGHGNMGQEIEKLLEESKKHTIVSISYKKDDLTLDTKGIKNADVAIDFTAPSIVIKNIEEVARLGVSMVIGTTGWYDQLSEAENIVKKKKIGLIYGHNFSIGANIFFKIVAYASKMFDKFGAYDVAGYEIHHTGKKDSPSGTAKKLSSIITQNFPSKKENLHFASLRTGRFPGFHEIIYDSFADDIRLSHNAHNRRGFAQGALLAAEFIKDKKGMYGFDKLFEKGGTI